ncbi:MAG: hypothetical protein RIS09_227 [Actinomycetota bacterium]|jgi:hypothetical protein
MLKKIALTLATALLSAGCGANTVETNETNERNILFVYDISNSAQDWIGSQVFSTNKWLESQVELEADVSVTVIDAFGGADSCTKPSTISISGADGNNEVTRASNREQQISILRTLINQWLKCESGNNNQSGSDLSITQFQGYNEVVIFTDGLLKSRDQNGLLNVYDAIRTDEGPKLQAQALSDYYQKQGVNLKNTEFSIWGLGFKKNLTAIEANRLSEFWKQLIVNLGGDANMISLNVNLP